MALLKDKLDDTKQAGHLKHLINKKGYKGSICFNQN